MAEDAKEQIEIILELLKNTLMNNGVSIGLSEKKKKIIFLIRKNIYQQESLMDFL